LINSVFFFNELVPFWQIAQFLKKKNKKKLNKKRKKLQKKIHK